VVKISDGAILNGLNLKLTYEQAEIVCKKDGRNYFYLDEEFKNDPRFAVIAVSSCEEVFDKLPEQFKTMPEIIKEKRLWIR
jgi:hypothetical protein